MKKRYFLFLILFSVFFINNVFSQGSTCSAAQPFCAGSNLTFANTTGVPSTGSPGCLGSIPNPAWFFLQIGNGGNLNFTISL